jgi:hypothetical protein
MVTNSNPEHNYYSTRRYDLSGPYRPWWAIPRVETQESQPTKKKRQFNNLALLFIIYVVKKVKKAHRARFVRKIRKEYKKEFMSGQTRQSRKF